jgi:hypothetical protein
MAFLPPLVGRSSMFVDVKRILLFLSTSPKPISLASQKPNLGGVAYLHLLSQMWKIKITTLLN